MFNTCFTDIVENHFTFANQTQDYNKNTVTTNQLLAALKKQNSAHYKAKHSDAGIMTPYHQLVKKNAYVDFCTFLRKTQKTLMMQLQILKAHFHFHRSVYLPSFTN